MAIWEMDGEFGVLEIETEVVDVTSGLPKPDKNWRHTDSNGHEHYWTADYETLEWVIDEVWTDEAGEEIPEGHFACKLCGETVVPGMAGPSGFREFAPGRTSARLNGEPITKERADEIMAAYRA